MKKNYILLISLSLFFFSSCKKELSDNFTLYTNSPLNDTIWINNVPLGASVHHLAELFLPNLVIDSFDCNKGDTLTFGDTLELAIKPGVCVAGPAGGPAPSGQVKLEFFRLKKKGDYIKFFKPTTSMGALLESAGGFFIRISKDGRELSLAQGASITVRFTDTLEPKTNMQVFYARETIPFLTKGIDTAHSWTRDADTSHVKTFQKTITNGTNTGILKGYELTTKNLRWFSAQRYTDSTLPKKKIFAILPLNFTNKNTAVFAVFANQKTVVGLGADFGARAFSAPNIPLKSKIILVSVSRIGTDLYLGVQEVNEVGSEVKYNLVPEKKSLLHILNYLNSL